MANRRSEMLWIGGLCLVGLAAWIGFRIYTGLVIEDAWITYRYAKNIALGNGFVYNIGERVLGTTSPLFALILALFAKVFGTEYLPMLSNLVMIPAGAGTGILTYLTLKKLDMPKGLSIFWLAVYVLHFNTLWSVVGGLETPLVMLLMAASLYSLVQGQPLRASVWASLLVLARIDGAIWSAGIFVLILMQHRREFWRATLIGLLIVGPWVVFAYSYFGSPIPHTVIAKSLIGQGDDYSSGWTMLSYFGWVMLHLSRISPFGRIAGFIFFLIGGWAIFRKYKDAVLKWVFVFPFVFSLAYYIGHAPKFPWYLIPLSWCGMIVGAIGIWEVGHLASESASGIISPRNFRIAVVVFFVMFGAALLNRDLSTMAFHKSWEREENAIRKPLGLWLRDNTPPDASIVMEAIGYQGYFSERRIIDLAGLISPQVVQWHRESQSSAGTFNKILTNERPAYVVLRSFEYETNNYFLGGKLFDTNEQLQYFEDHYHTVKQFAANDSTIATWNFRLTIYQSDSDSMMK